jgi:phosphoribosylformylglycinamidine synthase
MCEGRREQTLEGAGSGLKARVLIRPKAGILDPQGVAVERALPALGFSGVANVHVGRLVELELEEPQQLEAMCEKLLANPLVEDYEVELLDAGSGRAGEAGAASNGLGD